jgi:hypothetical protein
VNHHCQNTFVSKDWRIAVADNTFFENIDESPSPKGLHFQRLVNHHCRSTFLSKVCQIATAEAPYIVKGVMHSTVLFKKSKDA